MHNGQKFNLVYKTKDTGKNSVSAILVKKFGNTVEYFFFAIEDFIILAVYKNLLICTIVPTNFYTRLKNQ